MNVVAEARKLIPVTNFPNDNSDILYYIKPKQQFRISGIKRNGIDRAYSIQGGGFISIDNVHIIRDMDFFFDNVSNKDKVLMKNSLSTVGGRGVSSGMNTSKVVTDHWFDLQKFADPILNVTDIAPSMDKKNTNGVPYSAPTSMGGSGRLPSSVTQGVGGGFGGGISIGGSSSGSSSSGSGKGGANANPLDFPLIPTVGTTVPTVQTQDYSKNVLNTPLSSVLGNSNNKVSSLLKGTTVGSLMNGTFLGTVATNALGMLFSWTRGYGEFVAGFGYLSVLSSLFGQFGTEWKSASSSAFTNLFGSGGVSLMSKVTSGEPSYETNNYWKSGSGVKFFDVKSGEGDRYPFAYADVTQQMIDYFKYKGCNGAMIVKTYAGRTWEQDATYATPTLESKKDEAEIQFWKDLWNADYSEVTDSIDKIKESFNIHLVERRTLFTSFNRYRFPIPDHELDSTRGYVFFTRPDLNIDLDVSDISGLGRAYPLMDNINRYDPYVAGSLMKSGPPGTGDHEFSPILTHACTGIDVADEILDSIELGETFTGWKIKYGTSLHRSKTAGQVSCTFRDDSMLSVYKIMKTWCEYINAVYHGEFPPRKSYILTHELDYAIAIYYFLCRATVDNEILFWTKYTGCYPTSIPSSNFTDSLGNMIKQPTYTISFDYARKDDYNPMGLWTFDYITHPTNPQEYVESYDKDTLRCGTTFVGAPYISKPSGNGDYFKLRFKAP